MSTSLSHDSDSSTPDSFPFFSFSGTHREIGEQHGEALRERIRQHLEKIYAKGLRKAGLSREETQRLAESFIPFVRGYAPDFWEEIQGVARGASILTSEAMLLQVRQEVSHLARFGAHERECTTFAATAPYTLTGETLAGQNADLSDGMEGITAVIRFAPEGKPRVLMVTPAGQISYIGMNSAGIAACANFLYCTGWRAGFPRYLLTRLALEQSTLPDALAAALRPPRASSRNLMLTSRDGEMVDVETTAHEHASVWSQGQQVHTNHLISPAMRQFEAGRPDEIANSMTRYQRMTDLLAAERGRLTVERLQDICRDHANSPDSICAHREHGDDEYTFASLIAQLSAGRMWVAYGTPCAHPYSAYDA